MNQILVTQKLYITPELRRKKKRYKIQFLLSVLVVCSLFSYYIYADYDRNKSEEVSKEILAEIQNKAHAQSQEKILDNTIKEFDDVLVIALDDNEQDDNQIVQAQNNDDNSAYVAETYVADDGTEYSIDAIVTIPSLGIEYPVFSDWSEELLKKSLCKYWGPEPNEVGNYCIVGHNYRSGKMFGMLPAITDGDYIEVTDMRKERTITYEVYDRYQIDPSDTRCTSQLTDGNKEITLITCKEYGTQRLVVKAREVK